MSFGKGRMESASVDSSLKCRQPHGSSLGGYPYMTTAPILVQTTASSSSGAPSPVSTNYDKNF